MRWTYGRFIITTAVFPLKNYTKGLWQKPDAVPLDFSSCLYHTGLINRQEVSQTMDSEFLRELRQKYIQDPPEGMTAKLVQNNSDLLDM